MCSRSVSIRVNDLLQTRLGHGLRRLHAIQTCALELGIEQQLIARHEQLKLQWELSGKFLARPRDQSPGSIRDRINHRGRRFASATATRGAHAHELVAKASAKGQQLRRRAKDRPEEVRAVVAMHMLDEQAGEPQAPRIRMRGDANTATHAKHPRLFMAQVRDERLGQRVTSQPPLARIELLAKLL